MYKQLFSLLSIILLLASCSRLENIENDINDINNRLDSIAYRINDIESAIDIFEELHANGMLINDITPSDEQAGSWLITLSDGRTISVYNGDAKSHTPYLKIDQDGYWCISYDNGATFSRIIDNNGNFVKAPVSMYVTTDEEGYYVFVIHYANDPDNVIDVIKTPHTSDPSKIIHSITQSDIDHSITITMADGSSYTFDKEYTIPTSIAILTTKPLLLASGTKASVEFRVNPSNALFNYDTASDSCQIALDCITPTRGKSYVTPPTNYRLTTVEQVYDQQGVMKEGQYRAYIEDTNNSTLYNEDAALVLSVTNRLGNVVQISSSAFAIRYAGNIFTQFSFQKAHNPTLPSDIEIEFDNNSCILATPYEIDPTQLVASFESNGDKVLVNNIEQISGVSVNDFSKPVCYTIISTDGEVNRYTIRIMTSGLPIVYIETPNKATIPPKTEDWLPETSLKIVNADGSIDYEGTTNIRGRGNSTWKFSKKPYALKLESKASILGMPKHKRWVLLANYLDRTLLRNHVAFHIAMLTDLEWTPRGQHVELILNGEYRGNYYLCEQIKVDENRVNIHEMESSDIEGEALTSGYLMELDNHYDEVNKFKSQIRELPYMFKEPDEDVLTAEQFAYMQDYVNDFENALYNYFSGREWATYIDFNSFIDWWFVHELTHNSEASWPKSCYMYKDRNSPLKAGPVWDFDWGTFHPNYIRQHSVKSALYYRQLFRDNTFVATVKERWQLLKPQFKTVVEFIEAEAQRLEVSNESNIAMWPISERINGDETLGYREAIEQMKNTYSEKLNWLDKQIENL
ncbi:MAG: hypothetical protein E7084_05535 [Bacteroidales bacterium]|nr:hypothetical protein [Bacteroidales bacterium]